MYGIWWRTLWSGVWLIVLLVNIAFAFDVVSIVNPSSLDLNYPDYYFGMSSFIESFKTFFGENKILNGFMIVLRNYGGAIEKIYSFYAKGLGFFGRLMNFNPTVVDIISGIIALVLFSVNVIPMLMMVVLGLLYLVYILIFALQIILFVISFFGGAFATPLPSVYPELDTPISSIVSNLRAIMV